MVNTKEIVMIKRKKERKGESKGGSQGQDRAPYPTTCRGKEKGRK